MAEKKGGVEVLGKDVETIAADAKVRKVADGPTAGDDAPLFGVTPDLKASFGFDNGELFVEFSRATDEVEYDRAQADFLVAMIATQSRFMSMERRSGADAKGAEIDVGAKFSIRSGKLVIRFPESKKKPWWMNKLAAKKAVLEMRAKLVGLPRIAD